MPVANAAESLINNAFDVLDNTQRTLFFFCGHVSISLGTLLKQQKIELAAPWVGWGFQDLLTGRAFIWFPTLANLIAKPVRTTSHWNKSTRHLHPATIVVAVLLPHPESWSGPSTCPAATCRADNGKWTFYNSIKNHEVLVTAPLFSSVGKGRLLIITRFGETINSKKMPER